MADQPLIEQDVKKLKVYHDKILEQQMQFPSAQLDQLVFAFLPDPVDLAKTIVEMKVVNPNVFQRTEMGQCSRYMDHGLVSSLFLKLMRKKHGTAPHLKSFSQRISTALFALTHHTSLILIIEVVEQLASELRGCDGDLFNFIHIHKSAMEQMYTYYDEDDESSQMASMVLVIFNKVFFMILFANAEPHSKLILPPPPENNGTTQGPVFADGKFGCPVPTNAVVPFHPDWFGVKVPLFEQGPYYDWRKFWEADRLHTGVAHLDQGDPNVDQGGNKDRQRQINNDRLLVANILVTTTLGELKKLALEASSLQNKILGLGTTLLTTLGTFIVQMYNQQPS